MKKLILKAIGKPELVEIDRPSCTPDTYLLQTLYSGISNGTERNQLLGGNYAPKEFPFPRFGYQTISRVLECGSRTQRFKEGDKVVTGTFGTHAEFHLGSDDDLISLVPEGFDLLTGALVSVAAVAYHNIRRMDIDPADKVLICGAGLIGQCALQFSKLLGAETHFLSRGEKRARIAEQLGAKSICFGDDQTQADWLEKKKPFTAVVETCGSAALLEKLLGSYWGDGIFKRGNRNRLCILAGNDRISYCCNAAQAGQVSLMHSGHFDRQDQEAVVAAIHDQNLKLRPLIQDIFPASEAVSVFEKLRDDPSSLYGTILDWS